MSAQEPEPFVAATCEMTDIHRRAMGEPLIDCPIDANSILSWNEPMTFAKIERSKYIFEVRDKNEFLCGLNWDGTLDTGPNFKPDAAAKLFWDAVGHLARTVKAESPPGEAEKKEVVVTVSNSV